MKRIFSDYAYGSGPRTDCWWDTTIASPDWPEFHGPSETDVAIIGGGFTGVNAALHLVKAGVDVTVLEAMTPGWGASGRNGGFCCLGGSKISSHMMRRRYGDSATDEYEAGELSAIEHVAALIDKYDIDVDRHSQGETQLAHKPSAMKKLRAEAAKMEAEGIDPKLVEAKNLRDQGLNGEFYGAITHSEGFALNPRKYLFGIMQRARDLGARLYQQSPCQKVERVNGKWVLETPGGTLVARQLIVATNGYSSDDMPDWLSARYMPTQSTVMVTRPMSHAELTAQGWTSDQMSHDTRHMLHYFRLMPNRRFLFGMRGGLMSSAGSERRIRQTLRRHFENLFPEWRAVETTHSWSGMVCLSRNLVPFVGPVPGMPNTYAGLCYHGNGVAMGSYSGRILADMILDGQSERPYSPIMKSMGRFPFGRARRIVMPFAYAGLSLLD
ncbi:MAG: NAD(P)/FAD-dependent oxidoreductase [Paracoccaceae bacterium]